MEGWTSKSLSASAALSGLDSFPVEVVIAKSLRKSQMKLNMSFEFDTLDEYAGFIHRLLSTGKLDVPIVTQARAHPVSLL